MTQENAQTEPTKTFSRNSILLFMSLFFYMASLYASSSYLPNYATSLGCPAALATTIIGLTGLVPVILAIAVGIYMDRTGNRKNLVLVSLIISAIVGIGYIFSTTWQMLLAFRILQGVGMLFVLNYIVLLVLAMPRGKQHTAIGIFTVGQCAGTILIFAIGPILFSLGGITYTFYATIATAIIAALVLLPLKMPVHKGTFKVTGGVIKDVFKNPALIAQCATIFFAMGIQTAFAGVAPFVAIILLHIPLGSVALIFISSVVGGAIGGLVTPPMIGKIGSKIVTVAYAAGILVLMVLLTFVTAVSSTTAIIVFNLIFALLTWCILGVNIPMGGAVLQRLPREVTSVAQNANNTFMNLGQVVLPLVVGTVLGATYNFSASFLALIVLAVAGLICAIVFAVMLGRVKVLEGSVAVGHH